MKSLLLLAALSFSFCNSATSQILCIYCYDQNDSISPNVTNLILNGGFETTNCPPSTGVIGSATSFCPNSNGYVCDFADWTCTGGGTSTYSCLYNTVINKSIIIQGMNAVYFGNFYCNACSSTSDDISCLTNVDCAVTGVPAGYPINPDPAFGGSTGVSLQQTVSGLVPGNAYVLEFWAGGEESYANEGIFALDIGFGDTLLRNRSTGPGQNGIEYIVEFKATSASHTIKFTNWGHICGACTELVLDNVRLYPLSQLSSTVPSCVPQIVSFGTSDTAICKKFCVNFYDSSTNNPTAWHWLFPGGSPSSSTVQNPTNICYNTEGVYDVTLITTNATGNDTLILPNYITVYPIPALPTITQVGYTLTSSPAQFYQWQLNTIDIPGATNQSYIATQSGLYTVVVSDSNGCVNSADKDVTISGVSYVLNDGNISIYPNPATNVLMIEWLHGFAGNEVSIDVLNTLCQKVFSSQQEIASSSFKKEIDLTHIANGVYYIKLQSGNISVRKKIIIAR